MDDVHVNIDLDLNGVAVGPDEVLVVTLADTVRIDVAESLSDELIRLLGERWLIIEGTGITLGKATQVGLPRIVHGDPKDQSTWVETGDGDDRYGTLVIPPELLPQR